MWIKKSDYKRLVTESEYNKEWNKILLEKQDEILNKNQELENEIFSLKGLNTYEVRYNGEVSFIEEDFKLKGSTRTIIIHATNYTCIGGKSYVFYDNKELVADFTDVLSIRKV